MLGEMAVRVMGTRTFGETIQTILDDVIALQGAEYGTVQLPIGDELVIAAQRGFDPQILQMFRYVSKDDRCACGQALRLRQSIVVADVEKDPDYSPYLDAAKKAGFRSIRSTPFTTQDGKLTAIVSVYFAAPDRATRSEGGAFDLYSNVAAEQACELLGSVALSAKAAQMSDELYCSFVQASSGPNRTPSRKQAPHPVPVSAFGTKGTSRSRMTMSAFGGKELWLPSM